MLVPSIILLTGTVMAISPPVITTAPAFPSCRLEDPGAACPTFANCYSVEAGCSTSGCLGECAATSSCTIDSPSRTCIDPNNACEPFYSTCTTAGCYGACVSTDGPVTTAAPEFPSCRLEDPGAACPTFANCYSVEPGCSTSGCPGECAATSSCTIDSPSRTCIDPNNACEPFYSTCTTAGCYGACVSTAGPDPSSLLCSSGASCNPTGSCLTEGCGGLCLPTPTPLSACVVSDVASSCRPYSTCSTQSDCSTSGCAGLCLSTSVSPLPCAVSNPYHCTAQDGDWSCMPTGACSTSECPGNCLTVTPSPVPCTLTEDLSPVTPTPTPSVRGCRIGSPTSTCSPMESSTCVGTASGGCTTDGCYGTCAPIETATDAGTATCFPSYPNSTISVISSSTYIPTLPCIQGGGSTECPECHLCVAYPGACYGPGCEGECLPVPCATFHTTPSVVESSATSTWTPVYGGPTCVVGDDDSCPGRCIVCASTNPECSDPGCIGECLATPCAPPEEEEPPYPQEPKEDCEDEDPAPDNTAEPEGSATANSGGGYGHGDGHGGHHGGGGGVTTVYATTVVTVATTVVESTTVVNTVTVGPSPLEPSNVVRTFDCLVGVTAECLPTAYCEPYYGVCCNGLNCPGNCVDIPTGCPTQGESSSVTTTVTVFDGHGSSVYTNSTTPPVDDGTVTEIITECAPSLTEPALKTRTYDCLVSVTGGCGMGMMCEPWYDECCDDLYCPGRCVGMGLTCPVLPGGWGLGTVTTTVTVVTQTPVSNSTITV